MNKLEVESLENLQVSLQQNPDSLTFARVADALMKNGRLDEAIRICEEGIRRHPYYVTGHMVLGKCYMQKKYYDQAEKEFKRVLLFDPKYIAAHRYYGDLMREIGWDNTCEMSYRKILHLDPLDRNVHSIVEEFTRKAESDKAAAPEVEREPKQAKSAKPKSSRDTQTLPPKKNARSAPPASEPVIVSPPRSEPLNGDLEIPIVKPAEQIEPKAQPLNKQDEARFSSILDDIFQDEMMSQPPTNITNYQRGKSEAAPPLLPAPNRDAGSRLGEDESKNAAKQDKPQAEAQSPSASVQEQPEVRNTTSALVPSKRRPVELDIDLDELAANADRVWAPAPSGRAAPENPAPMPEKPLKPTDTETLSLAGLRDSGARDRIVTPTLGEIYAAQGQFAKAIGVFELLSKKDPANRNYREKIDYLKKRLQETQNAE